jgi:hypothetical protein
MQLFNKALEAVETTMRAGMATHAENEWTWRTADYHIARAEEHLRLLRDGNHEQDHLAHAATRLLMALTQREVA